MPSIRPISLVLASLALVACGQKDADTSTPPTVDAGPPAPQYIAQLDVCATFPLATVEAAIGKVRKSRPLSSSGSQGASPYSGGCHWIAEKLKNVRVEIGNEASVAAAKTTARAVVDAATAGPMQGSQPLAGLGEAAMIKEDGPVVMIVAASGSKVVQVISGDIGRDATITLTRTALEQ